MPDVIRHPAGGGAGGLDSCFRRNDGRLYRIVICSQGYRALGLNRNACQGQRSAGYIETLAEIL